jgi:hypothetical protein
MTTSLCNELVNSNPAVIYLHNQATFLSENAQGLGPEQCLATQGNEYHHMLYALPVQNAAYATASGAATNQAAHHLSPHVHKTHTHT